MLAESPDGVTIQIESKSSLVHGFGFGTPSALASGPICVCSVPLDSGQAKFRYG
jgi:hypothetical protein